MDARSWHVRSPRWLIRTEWHRACESQKAGRSKSPSEFKCASLACSGTLPTFFITPVKTPGEEKEGRRGIKSRGSREERADFATVFFFFKCNYSSQILAIAMVMAVTCEPTPKPALSPVVAYPLVYPTTYARVYPYYAVPLTYYNSYNSYRWFYPGSFYAYWYRFIGTNVDISARDARRPVCPITWRAKWFYVKCFSNKVHFCRKRRSMLVDSIKISPPLGRRSCQRPLRPVNSLGLREEALIRAWQTKRYRKRYQFCCPFVSAIFIVYRIIAPFFMGK